MNEKRIFLDSNDKPIPLNIAKEILENCPIITLKDNEEMMYYNDGIYHPGAYTLIKEKAQEIVPFIPKRYKEEVIELIKGLTYIDREKLNENKDFIPVKNGIYDLKTKTLFTKKSEIICTREIPIFYDPNRDCPKIKQFIKEIVGEDQFNLIQELFGYCLINDYPFNKAFMLFGQGRNGKTTFLNLLIGFLGEDNINSASLQDLCYNRFAKKDLFGKLANIYDDLPNTELKQTGNFKIMTGKGRVYADVKFKDHFEFMNIAKLIFSCNELPTTFDTTDAFFRRWNIVRFNTVFEGEKEDTSLPYSIMTDDEMSGLFNWALEGIERLYKQNGFSTSETTEDTKSEWILRTDPMRAFVAKYVEYSPTEYITKDEFAIALNEFCIDHNSAEITKQKIGQRLPAILPKIGVDRVYIEGKQERVWKGITFKSKKPLEENQSNGFVSIEGDKKEQNKTDIQANLYSSITRGCIKEELKKVGLLSSTSNNNSNLKQIKKAIGEEFIEEEFINFFLNHPTFDEKIAKKTLNLWKEKGIVYEFKQGRYKWIEK